MFIADPSLAKLVHFQVSRVHRYLFTELKPHAMDIHMKTVVNIFPYVVDCRLVVVTG
jgi:hypothetical protein